MKPEFFDYMLTIMRDHPNVYLIFAGLGYPRVEEFQKAFPDRAFNFEASEQTCLDAAVGLAYDGKIPVVYTITPFFYRGFETIRTYINHESLPVKLVGCGVDDEYAIHDGFSHDASDIKPFMDLFENIEQYYPRDVAQMKRMIDVMILNGEPSFLNIHK